MKIILLYGGRSEEHDVSVLSAYSVLNAIYYKYYQVQLVFISKDGQWVKGPLLSERPQNKEVLHLTWAQTPEETGEFSGKRISPSEIYEEEAIVFPVLHGPNGEDGTIQGFMETINMPYVGAGVLASANAMDKIMTKYLLQTVGIPQVPFVPVFSVFLRLMSYFFWNMRWDLHFNRVIDVFCIIIIESDIFHHFTR